ncbi:MAG: 3-mercaptopyruvate sulfurtransferase [Paracoccaceae bacterium]|jgi:thiosulfate/3-mercaptopyruvate sulfurtransferase
MDDNSNTLISTDWLAFNLKNPNVRIIDASWYLPDMKRNPREEYDKAHIPGARFFDIDEICDLQSKLPHMVPSPEKFVSRIRAMGIGDKHKIVIYDGAGLFSAARVWWLFKLMGKAEVSVLDGGFPKWLNDGYPSDNQPVFMRDQHMTTDFHEALVKNVTQVSAASKLGDHEILDARGPGRFAGKDPEPRKGLRAGHIPGSKNIHYKDLLNDDGTMKDKHSLFNTFKNAKVDFKKPIITTCGSGVTAAIISLALEIIGQKNHSLYDGSWTEWGQFDQLPIEVG